MSGRAKVVRVIGGWARVVTTTRAGAEVPINLHQVRRGVVKFSMVSGIVMMGSQVRVSLLGGVWHARAVTRVVTTAVITITAASRHISIQLGDMVICTMVYRNDTRVGCIIFITRITVIYFET